MKTSGTSSQVMSLITGGGARHGIGETFLPDLDTGTGHFTVPSTLPLDGMASQPDNSLGGSGEERPDLCSTGARVPEPIQSRSLYQFSLTIVHMRPEISVKTPSAEMANASLASGNGISQFEAFRIA
jgi:hypothetical protein